MQPSRTARASGIRPERRAEQDQDGPETLAAGERDVLPEIPDELDRRVGQLAIDLRLAGTERVADEPQEPLPEDAFHAEAHGTRLATGGTRGRIAHRSANDGERQGERRGELGVRVVLERPVLPHQHEPRATPRASAAAGIRRNTRSPSRQSPPPNGTVSARPLDRRGPRSGRPTAGSGRRGGPVPASSRNRWAIAGGSGCSKGDRDHRHAGAGTRARPRERHLDEPRAGLGDQQTSRAPA